MITLETELNINNRQLDVVVWGTCARDMTGTIKCDVKRVLTPDGVDVYGAVREQDMEALRVRLFAASLANRVMDANEVPA